jgi:hypothetical protein
MSSKTIPQADSIVELAHFWDHHDLTDFEHELEEVSKPVFERERVMKVRLPNKEADALQKLAQLPAIRSERRAEGPAIHPAQGTALGNEGRRLLSSAQRANRSR